MFIRNDEKITKLFKSYDYYDGFFDKDVLAENETHGFRFYHNEEETKIIALAALYNKTYLIHIMDYEENSDSPEEYSFNTIEEALEFIKSL